MSLHGLDDRNFFIQALAWKGSITPKVLRLVIYFSIYSCVVTVQFLEHPTLNFNVGPFEISGAVLGLLLVLRTNSGYDRWWEARKLWGGIVNQSRNLAVSLLSYSSGKEWQYRAIQWIAAFPYVAKQSLRGKRDLADLNQILSESEIQRIQKARHMPGFVLMQIAHLLQEAKLQGELDLFGFIQIDKERAQLMDHLGGCERILKTPLPWVITVKVRRFILLFLAVAPFLLVKKSGIYTPVVMVLVSYSILSLDQIGIELQNPFSQANLSHLPLDEIARNISEDVLSFFRLKEAAGVRQEREYIAEELSQLNFLAHPSPREFTARL